MQGRLFVVKVKETRLEDGWGREAVLCGCGRQLMEWVSRGPRGELNIGGGSHHLRAVCS